MPNFTCSVAIPLLLLIVSISANADDCNPKMTSEDEVRKQSESGAIITLPDYLFLTKEEKQKLKEKAQKGDVDSARLLGDHYRVLHTDPASALPWYLLAAKNGDVTSEIALADLYSNNGPCQDVLQSIEWLRKAADSGNVSALRRMGDSYWSGITVQPNSKKAIEYYVAAARSGDAESMLNLSRLLVEEDKSTTGLIRSYVYAAVGVGLVDTRLYLGRQLTERRDVLEKQLSSEELEVAKTQITQLQLEIHK